MKWTLNQLAAPLDASVFKRAISSRRLISLALLLALVGGLAGWMVKRRADREFESARAALERSAFVPFDKELRRALEANGITLMQSHSVVRDLARFNDSYVAATDGGLVELAQNGSLKRVYTVLDGLPESDLLCLAAFQSKLMIGTRSEGLVAFDGKRFERFRWTDRKAQAVTALAEASGRLLIGTFAGGLLEFDGKRFREIKAEPEQKRMAGINCVVADDSRLLVGTFGDGLWINQADRWMHFTVADGLPSNRVVGVVREREYLLVATDFGVSAISARDLFAGSSSQKRFQTLATLPATASIVAWGDSVLLCRDSGEVFRLVIDERRASASINSLEWRADRGAAGDRSANLSSCQLRAFESKTGQTSGQKSEQALWLLTSEGIWRTDWQDERFAGRLRFSNFGELKAADGLSSNLISAMAFDDLGRLWMGSFRNGIDVFTPEGRRVTHIESETVREINALVWDGTSKRMLAATAGGLAQFEEGFRIKRLGTTDGLLSNSVSHVTAFRTKSPAGVALATSRGLSLGEPNRWQALTTVHGLPSNSVYAVLPHREFLYAGTLSGLAEIAAGRVVRVFKDTNSKLTNNWVTALCVAGDRIFVGTYGGGLFELTLAGELTGFSSEIGRQSINPNAMSSDGEWLYVGTLDGAWAMDLRSQKWTHLREELPSRTVMSIAVDQGHVYLGTTNGIARIERSSWRRGNDK